MGLLLTLGIAGQLDHGAVVSAPVPIHLGIAGRVDRGRQVAGHIALSLAWPRAWLTTGKTVRASIGLPMPRMRGELDTLDFRTANELWQTTKDKKAEADTARQAALDVLQTLQAMPSPPPEHLAQAEKDYADALAEFQTRQEIEGKTRQFVEDFRGKLSEMAQVSSTTEREAKKTEMRTLARDFLKQFYSVKLNNFASFNLINRLSPGQVYVIIK